MRIPTMFSRTVCTIRSTFCWVTVYIGMPFLEINQMVKPISGIIATRTAPNRGSIAIVTMIPPISRIGARTPSRCIMFSIRWTL